MQLSLAVISILLLHCVQSTFRVVYPIPWMPLVANTVTYRSNDPVNLENLQIAQFHSQDAAGRYVFGFNTPDQARVEARSHDGKVRGSFSYLDPFGRMVKVEYWDNGNGFHMAEPANSHMYTPEVQSARDLHFHLYNQALQAALVGNPVGVGQFLGTVKVEHHGFGHEGSNSYGHQHPAQNDKNNEDNSSSTNKKPSTSGSAASSTSSSSSSPSTTGFNGQSDFGSQPDYSKPDFGLDSIGSTSFNQKPNYGSSDFGAGSSSSSTDFGYGQTDYDKQPDYSEPDYNSKPEYPYEPPQDFYSKVDEQYDFINTPNNKEIFDADKEAIIVDSDATSDSELKERNGKNLKGLFDYRTLSARMSLPNKNNDEGVEVHVLPVQSSEKDATLVESSVGKDGFFYQFQHPVLPQQISPVVSNPQANNDQPPSAKINTVPESLYASLYGAIPVDAIHDTQVSPKQQNSVPNHQTLPLFINLDNQKNP